MNNTVKCTNDYVYNNVKLDKTREIIENTIDQYERKYGGNFCKIKKVICNAKFSDKIKNETKLNTIESFNIVGELNRIMQSSKGFNKLIRRIKLKFIIIGNVYKNVINLFLKSENIPKMCRKHYMKFLNENRPMICNHHCRELHFFRQNC